MNRAWIIVALTLGAGCASVRNVAPYGHSGVDGPRRAHRGLVMFVDPVEFSSDDEIDPAVAEDLRHALLGFLRSGAGWAAVFADPAPLARYRKRNPEQQLVTIRPRIAQRHSVSRTIVLDVLACMSYGLLPFSLAWGEVEVEVELELVREDGTTLGPPRVARVSTGHSTLVHGLFRVDRIEDAFQRAYDRAFREVADGAAAMASREPQEPERDPSVDTSTQAIALDPAAVTSTPALALPVALFGAPAILASAPLAPPPRREPPPPALAAHGLLPSQPAPIHLPPDGFDVLIRPLGRESDGLLSRYLGALGGIEAAAFRGGASVESRTFTGNSPDELVGSGEAETVGYRFSLHRPPDRTGFFFPPSIGLLWQDITITGFRQTLPQARSGDIPAVASDPSTGERVDVFAPLSYDLQLRSGFLGQGLGFNLVAGNDVVQLFVTTQGHVNLLEVRHVDVLVGRNQVDGAGVVAFRSAGLGAQAGFVFPTLHLAVRGTVQAEWFFDFDFPQPVEFQASARYNAEKDVFERERAFVRGASVRTYNAQIAVGYLF